LIGQVHVKELKKNERESGREYTSHNCSGRSCGTPAKDYSYLPSGCEKKMREGLEGESKTESKRAEKKKKKTKKKKKKYLCGGRIIPPARVKQVSPTKKKGERGWGQPDHVPVIRRNTV